MLKIKVVTKCILYLTIVSVCLLLVMKYLEISKSYPRKEFCMTCPSQPNPSIFRSFEEHIDFNLFLMLDFLSMMMIILLFGSEKYHHHPTYLFSFHVCRLIFNTTIFSSSNVVDKVLRPIFEEFCGFGGKCSDERVAPHTPVATLYLLFFVLMTINFEICIILLYYNDPYRRPRTPMIVRVGDVEHQHRRYFRLDNSSSSSDPDPHPPTGYCSSPRLAFTKAFVPFSKTQKYHRLDACVSSALRSSKYRIAPLTIPIPPKLIN